MKEDLEPALAAAVADANAAKCTAARDQAARTEVEFRAGTMAESLNLELEAERGKARGLEEKVRPLEKVRKRRGVGLAFSHFDFLWRTRAHESTERTFVPAGAIPDAQSPRRVLPEVALKEERRLYRATTTSSCTTTVV